MEAWLRPMLCGTADAPPTGERWILEPKLDGWRAVTYRRDSQVAPVLVHCGRNGSRYDGMLPYVEADLIGLLPLDSAVDGELVGARGATCRA